MDDIKEYFQESDNMFTIFVVEQRFVVGQGQEYFKSYRGTANYISSEESLKKEYKQDSILDTKTYSQYC